MTKPVKRADDPPSRYGVIEAWRDADEVEATIFEWVDWFDNRGLIERPCYIAPAEAQARVRTAIAEPNMAA